MSIRSLPIHIDPLIPTLRRPSVDYPRLVPAAHRRLRSILEGEGNTHGIEVCLSTLTDESEVNIRDLIVEVLLARKCRVIGIVMDESKATDDALIRQMLSFLDGVGHLELSFPLKTRASEQHSERCFFHCFPPMTNLETLEITGLGLESSELAELYQHSWSQKLMGVTFQMDMHTIQDSGSVVFPPISQNLLHTLSLRWNHCGIEGWKAFVGQVGSLTRLQNLELTLPPNSEEFVDSLLKFRQWLWGPTCPLIRLELIDHQVGCPSLWYLVNGILPRNSKLEELCLQLRSDVDLPGLLHALETSSVYRLEFRQVDLPTKTLENLLDWQLSMEPKFQMITCDAGFAESNSKLIQCIHQVSLIHRKQQLVQELMAMAPADIVFSSLWPRVLENLYRSSQLPDKATEELPQPGSVQVPAALLALMGGNRGGQPAPTTSSKKLKAPKHASVTALYRSLHVLYGGRNSHELLGH
eukprot:Nitzschia sp. Nitz4//scaffold164_size50480//48797//50280//NITZ4_007011-RA/size50480-augustus-gene-0.51-mRNA-1//1//CDS//3329538101//7346//frame0